MRIDKLRVTCQGCEHVFDVEIVVDCPIDVSCASMRAVRCPKCYSNKCGLGGNYTDAPPVTAPLADRVNWWRDRGEQGTSSKTIFAVFAGIGGLREGAPPRDPDDFRRCKQLLDLIPEWRADLDTVAKVNPWFKPMIDQWAEIERLYAIEEKKHRAPLTYAFMRPLLKECERLQRKA